MRLIVDYKTNISYRTLMEYIEKWPVAKTFFIFDLEFIGDVRKLSTCKIWEIAVYSVSTQQWFEAVIDPDPSLTTFPPPPIPQIPQLTRKFLQENNAQSWSSVYIGLQAWITEQSTGTLPVFVSHNTYRADKPILELECRRAGHRMPSNWYFFDSLHFSRRFVKHPSGNYSLSGLHKQLFNCPIENVHRARADVVACVKILSSITDNTWCLKGPIYPVYTTGLRTIRWIGQKAEEILYDKNIRSVEELLNIIQKNARSDKIQFNFEFHQSVVKTMTQLISSRLPTENINNIALVISAQSNTLCYAFMN